MEGKDPLPQAVEIDDTEITQYKSIIAPETELEVLADR